MTHPRFHDQDMLTVTVAASIAQRSTRTIRRAYLSGRLLAHRDGNGRSVRIRYGDLRDWLLAELIAPISDVASSQPVARFRVPRKSAGGGKTGNLELLGVVRERHARRTRTSASGRPSGGRASSGSG